MLTVNADSLGGRRWLLAERHVVLNGVKKAWANLQQFFHKFEKFIVSVRLSVNNVPELSEWLKLLYSCAALFPPVA